jgi:GNAT superfamily N-acetyltransferase
MVRSPCFVRLEPSKSSAVSDLGAQPPLVRPVLPEDDARLTAFFEQTGSACYCQYHDFTGDARAFQWTMAACPEANREALRASLGRGLTALVAEDEGQVVGWIRYGLPASNKLMQQRLYVGLTCFSGPRQGVVSVYCLLVSPERRRQGVARALLHGLIETATREGLTAIEALPRGATDVRDEELWTGPLALYLEAGFSLVHDFAPYPVVRHELGVRAEEP